MTTRPHALHASGRSGRHFCLPGARLPTAQLLPSPKLLSRDPPLPLLQVAHCTLRLAPHPSCRLDALLASSPSARLFSSLLPHPRSSHTNQRSPWSLTNRASPPQPILPRAAVSDGRRCALQANYTDRTSEPAHLASQLERWEADGGDGACTY